MSNIFRGRESALQDEALNQYANELRKAQQGKDERNEAINAYNEKLTGLTSTIGGIIGAKPVEKVVRSGVQKALGYTQKKVEEKITSKLSQLANGDSTFMDKLPSNVGRDLKAVLQDNPNNEIVSAFKNLPKSARDTINKARDRLGKREINENQETTEPRGADTSATTTGADEESGAAASGEGDLTGEAAENLSAAQSSAASFPERFANLSDEGRAAVQKGMVDHPNFTPTSSNPTDAQLETNGRIAQDQLAKQEQIEGTQPREQPDPSPTDPAPAPDEPNTSLTASDTAGSGTPDGAAATEQQGASVADSDGAAAATSDATEIGGQAAADTADGLSGVADALDVAAAAEGGGNIFVDIAAGIASLATIIGGEAGRKAPAQVSFKPEGSMIQYGI
jgi:hypothetical protein